MSPERHYNAALLHISGYRDKTFPSEPDRPDARQRLIISAAKLLHKEGIVQNMVISGKAFLDRPTPISIVTAKDLQRKTHLPESHIHVNDTAVVTTTSELKTLRSEAREHRWDSVISLGWSTHLPRIRTLTNKFFRKKDAEVDIITAERVLLTHGSIRNQERYKKIIEGIHNSESEEKWERYEKKLRKLVKIPMVPELLDMYAKFHRPKAD